MFCQPWMEASTQVDRGPAVTLLLFATGLTKVLLAEWQVRVCYYWYKKMKLQYPDSALGGFTRILHRCAAHQLPSPWSCSGHFMPNNGILLCAAVKQITLRMRSPQLWSTHCRRVLTR